MKAREEIHWFSKKMESKWKEWDGCGVYELIYKLQDEAEDLLNTVNSWVEGETSVENIIDSSVDVAISAMMIANITRKYLKNDKKGE